MLSLSLLLFSSCHSPPLKSSQPSNLMLLLFSLSSTEDDSSDVETQSFVRAKDDRTISRDVSPKQQSKHFVLKSSLFV